MSAQLRAYKTELDPNNRQRTLFARHAGAARFVYNWALADRIERFKAGEPTNLYEQKRRFNALKKAQYPWLSEVAYRVQEQAFANLDLAYKNFFRRVKKGESKKGFPRFKSRRRGLGSFTLRQGFVVEAKRIKLPVLGWVRLKEANYLPQEGVKILSANISEHAGRWFISLQVEQEQTEPTPVPGPTVAIHMGLRNLVWCSDGQTFAAPKHLVRNEKKLAHLQRELCRRKKGSKNREKTRRKVAKLHLHIANMRANSLHQISHHLTAKTKPGLLVLEQWDIADMLESGKGILSKPIADASWGELGRQLRYKAAWQGIAVLEADRYYPSSRTCSGCGSIKPFLRLSERTFKCEACGLTLDRDINAPRNLEGLAAKRAASACGGGVSLGASQAVPGEAGTEQGLSHQSRTTLRGSPHARGADKC